MSDFADCLSEIRDHYKSNIATGSRGRYVPSERFSSFFSNVDLKSLGDDANNVTGGLKDNSQGLTQEEASRVEAKITEATQKLENTGVNDQSKKSFREEMEKQREEAKKKSGENIDKIFDQAIQLGEEHPQYQKSILAVTEAAMALIEDVYSQIANFVSNIINTISEWVKNAWNDIKNEFTSIGNTISGWFS